MKCVCGHENNEDYITKDYKVNPDAFKSIGYTCQVEEVSTIGYYKLHVNKVSELFVCPKCGTVRIKT